MSLSYLDAMLIMGLAAEIHGTDAAVKRAAERCAKKVERRYRPVVYNVVNSVSPYFQIVGTIATIPDSILMMDPKRVPSPHKVYAQLKEERIFAESQTNRTSAADPVEKQSIA